MIRFNENKNYIQGMFYSNKSKITETLFTTLEIQSDESIKKTLTNDLEILNLDNKDDESLVMEA